MDDTAPHKDPGATGKRFRRFMRRNGKAILFWLVLVLILAVGLAAGLDRHAVAAAAILWGLATQIFAAAFAILVSGAGAVPLLGPFLVKAITVPVFILINGLAFMASLVGLKLGHKRRVFESRVAATILTIGMLIGYILGKIF